MGRCLPPSPRICWRAIRACGNSDSTRCAAPRSGPSMDIAVERTLSVSQARLLCIVLLFAFPLFAQSTASSDVGKQWWEHVKVIADDKNEGRETGSPGMQRAADYVVKTLKANGISPAGSNGYYQPVRLIQRSLDESQSSITLVHDNKDEPIKLGDEAYFSTRVDLAPSVNAKLVFVGYGLKVPEADYDDLAGQDLRGKVVVYISGAPSSVPPDLVSHYQSAGERWKALGTAGAIGAIGIPNPAAMDIPWSRLMVSRLHPSMRLADDSLLETKGWQLLVTWNPESADKLLAGSGHTAAELFALVKDKKPLPRFELPASLKATTKLEYKNIDSYNIVAKLPGSDSKLKAENVVLSAHLDHIGIGEPINGDRLYNGAMDNGSGAA